MLVVSVKERCSLAGYLWEAARDAPSWLSVDFRASVDTPLK